MSSFIAPPTGTSDNVWDAIDYAVYMSDTTDTEASRNADMKAAAAIYAFNGDVNAIHSDRPSMLRYSLLRHGFNPLSLTLAALRERGACSDGVGAMLSLCVARELFDAIPDINVNYRLPDVGGNTALHLAAMHASHECFAQFYLDHGADISARNDKGETAFDCITYNPHQCASALRAILARRQASL